MNPLSPSPAASQPQQSVGTRITTFEWLLLAAEQIEAFDHKTLAPCRPIKAAPATIAKAGRTQQHASTASASDSVSHAFGVRVLPAANPKSSAFRLERELIAARMPGGTFAGLSKADWQQLQLLAPQMLKLGAPPKLMAKILTCSNATHPDLQNLKDYVSQVPILSAAGFALPAVLKCFSGSKAFYTQPLSGLRRAMQELSAAQWARAATGGDDVLCYLASHYPVKRASHTPDRIIDLALRTATRRQGLAASRVMGADQAEPQPR